MTRKDIEELKHIAIDIMLNALDNKDAGQFFHGLKLWQDMSAQGKGATV